MGDESPPQKLPYGRLSSPEPMRATRLRSIRPRSALTIALTFGLAVVLVLSLVPLRPGTRTSELLGQYAVAVPAGGLGVQWIGEAFQAFCDSASYSTGLVGNQTYWLTWQTSGTMPPDYVRLQILSVATLYNASGATSGGYAPSSPDSASYFCGTPLELAAYSSTALTLSVEVGLVYSHSERSALL